MDEVNKNRTPDLFGDWRAKSIKLRVPFTCDSNEDSALLKSRVHALWMMTVTVSRSYKVHNEIIMGSGDQKCNLPYSRHQEVTPNPSLMCRLRGIPVSLKLIT